MSNYFYKGVNLTSICVNDGKTGKINNYTGVPNTNGLYSDYSSMRPLSFGYVDSNGADLSKYYTANYTVYVGSSKVNTVPTGSKSCRIITIGGAGGDGGDGGSASAKKNVNNTKNSKSDGGSGGLGGYGYFAYGNSQFRTGGYIEIIVGGAGSDGLDGANYSANVNNSGNTKEEGTGGDGGDGGAGSPSGFYYYESNGKQITAISSSGGNGGNGGNGAIAYAKTGSTNSYPGNAGNAGSPSVNDRGINNAYYNFNADYGNPTAGSNGAVIVIWLYD